MNPKRVVGITLTVIFLLLLAAGIRTAQTRDVAAEAPRVPQVQPVTQPQRAEQARPIAAQIPITVTETLSGPILTQTFELHAGWNAIYLGVEPINGSPLGSDGVPTKSMMEWVFGDLGAALDSVWTYNQPVSNKDYIVDPGEGLWDEPGWVRYIPDTNVGPDGESRSFLTTLHTLHANTGYLVNMNASGTITVTGRPVPGHHRWAAGAYNLAGFPITPGQSPTVATFVPGYPAASITEIRTLNGDGTWSIPMTGAATLAAGAAYLVRYGAKPAVPDYTAPLDLAAATGGALPSEGLRFEAGMYGNRVTLMVRNRSASVADVTVSLPGTSPGVALYYTGIDLRTAPVTFSLNPGSDGILLDFLVQNQPADAEALLAISSNALGTRWLLPVAAEPSSHAGLWVGDVIINDVSQARLGASDETQLTVRMASANSSGVNGTADLEEVTDGPNTTVQIAMNLTLPVSATQTVSLPEVDAPYVGGRVFVDANQNGKADRTEQGLGNITVHFSTFSAVTAADGSYRLHVTGPGFGESPILYNITSDVPDGYTALFPVEIPSAEVTEPPTPPTVAANVWPQTVTVDALGASAATPQSYLAQVLAPPHTLPLTDDDGQRVEPPLNFGYVQQDQAGIYSGACGGELRDMQYDLGAVTNGQLAAEVPSTLADLIGTNTTNNISVLRNDIVIACGEITAGAPTSFSDGRGSQARFRVLLRVSAGGNVELLPYYVITGTERISAVNFLSLQQPKMADGAFGTSGTAMTFNVTLPGNDPLNPFKHKYSPDHDNLDRKFNPIASSTLYEAYNVVRQITLTLRDVPRDADAATAQSMDWGGTTWGGDYREVLDGLHKNTITVRGFFTIRQVLASDGLTPQDYD